MDRPSDLTLNPLKESPPAQPNENQLVVLYPPGMDDDGFCRMGPG